MYRVTFALAMLAPVRQLTFRWATTLHLAVVAVLAWNLDRMPGSAGALLLGQGLLILAIVEGAVLIGWRLTQLPRSQSLEFVLASPLPPRRFFLAEAGVGATRLVLIHLAGFPVLACAAMAGRLGFADVAVLIALPLAVGLATGLGLAAWAYESIRVRKVGEILGLIGVLTYLTVGLLAGERLKTWLVSLPAPINGWTYDAIMAFKNYNPFGVMQAWMETATPLAVVLDRLFTLMAILLGMLAVFTFRAAGRLRGHFRDRHYTPATSDRPELTRQIKERPLSWWAVRRVMEYSGRVNLWLAGGFGVLYAAYILAGDAWPPWMGRMVFHLFEQMGGAPALVTGLVLLAAVPAAFQYGLWDSSDQDRCRRLELLLLTDLGARDYWHAALAAAWRRGRGYLIVAGMLWAALWYSGTATTAQVLASAAAAVMLWGFAFAVGFRAFSRGAQANGLGSMLTLGLPVATVILARVGIPWPAALLPPGGVYVPLVSEPGLAWMVGPALTGVGILWLVRSGLRHCDTELRRWYSENQGRKLPA